MVVNFARPLALVSWTPRSQLWPVVPSWDSPEYLPTASACQMSTAAPLIGLQVEESMT
jgi:hypothetical protein